MGAQCFCPSNMALNGTKMCIGTRHEDSSTNGIQSLSSPFPDADECAKPETCDQLCENSRGSYVCQCIDGYSLMPDGKTCKVAGMQQLTHVALFCMLF
jgi:hypothetical protein